MFVFCVCGFECGIVCVVDLCVSGVCRVDVGVFVCLLNVWCVFDGGGCV